MCTPIYKNALIMSLLRMYFAIHANVIFNLNTTHSSKVTIPSTIYFNAQPYLMGNLSFFKRYIIQY